MNEIELLIQVQSEPTTERKKFNLPFFYRESEHSPCLIRLSQSGKDVIQTKVTVYGKEFCIFSSIYKVETEPIPAKAVIISQAAFDTVYDAIIDQLIKHED